MQQTALRAEPEKTILAIQDTSYFSWRMPKTKGLGIISRTPGKNVNMIASKGLVMHTCFAVNTDGLPIGILDQKLFARKQLPDELRQKKKRSHNTNVAIEDKESIRWLESLKKTHVAMGCANVRTVTLCDREGDFYEFLECANKLEAHTLVRARGDRSINKISRYSSKDDLHLWSYMQSMPSIGIVKVEIPASDQKPARTAVLETRVGSFKMNPPRNHIRSKTEDLPDLNLNAVYVAESQPPTGEEALEWMLLTDLPISNFDEATEKVRWYCLRWRIEVFHKILKSGLKVEDCRLGTADRLIRYLTVMSIIAWRIFWITLVSRSNPDMPCSALLADEEWKVLYAKIHRGLTTLPSKVPSIREAVRWIAQLGGFLGRKGDGEPGPIALWRGWKWLVDLSEGWSLARG